MKKMMTRVILEYIDQGSTTTNSSKKKR